MAEIYLAQVIGAAGVTKDVVVKKILPVFAQDSAFVRMFIDEARLAMKLAHGNIAQVFDFGEIEGEYFIAMERVNGPSLARLLELAQAQRIRIPIPIATFIALEACKGLHYAHTRVDAEGRSLGVVHRDVSPQNVLVSHEGQVKIVDFGIAKARDSSTHTEPGQLKGKWAYFAPEQAAGKRDIDARTDVFAAGVLLYEMLCGRRPFEGGSMDMLSRIIGAEFEPPSAHADVPEELEDIVLRAMAKDPADRFSSAQAMQEALGQFLYAHAPRFHGENLALLVRWLCRDEIRRTTGRSPSFPPEFLEQVPLWKSDAPTQRESGDGPSPIDDGAAFAGSPSARPSGVPRWALAAALLAGAAVAGGIAAVVATRPPSESLLLASSTPSGASIYVDGRPSGFVTREGLPTEILGLAPGRHEVRLKYIGYQDQVRQVTLVKDDPKLWREQRIEAVLERVPEARPLTQPIDPADLKMPPRRPEREFSHGPLDPLRHAIAVPETPAARHALNPAHTYRLSVSGEADLFTGKSGIGAHMPIHGVWFYARGPGPASAGQLLPRRPATVKGASELFGFVLAWEPRDGGGTVTLSAKDLTTGRSFSMPIDAEVQVIGVREHEGAVLDALGFRGENELRARCDAALGKGGAPGVVYFHEPTGSALSPIGMINVNGPNLRPDPGGGDSKFVDDVAGLIPSGGSAVPRSTFTSVRFFLLDDDLADNSGSCEVQVFRH
jgi:serine/threonine protein kinase